MTSTQEAALITVAQIVLLALVFVVSQWWLRPRHRRRFAGTGYEEWQQVAATLPWRQRVAIVRSNAAGRRAPGGWEALAAQHARMTPATGIVVRGGRWRRCRAISTAGYAVVLVLAIVQVVFTHGRAWCAWIEVVGFAMCLVLWSRWSMLQRRRLERVRRSSESNTGASARSSTACARRRCAVSTTGCCPSPDGLRSEPMVGGRRRGAEKSGMSADEHGEEESRAASRALKRAADRLCQAQRHLTDAARSSIATSENGLAEAAERRRREFDRAHAVWTGALEECTRAVARLAVDVVHRDD